MKTLVPDYYLKFHCIAEKCRNNCCRAGWEIELDDNSAGRYKELCQNKKDAIEKDKTDKDVLAKQLSQSVSFPSVKQRKEGCRPHIIMKEDRSCPFLNSKNLCDLILNYGEEGICQICRDHPRFRNFYKDHMELGIGMCCEEAARLILSSESPFKYQYLENGEEGFPYFRRARGLEQVLAYNKADLDIPEWICFLKSLEQLEAKWTLLLERFCDRIETADKSDSDQNQNQSLEQNQKQECEAVLEYLLFRHFDESGPAFVSFCYRLICRLNESGIEDLDEICRLFSTEIEYSDVNRIGIIRRLEASGYGKQEK